MDELVYSPHFFSALEVASQKDYGMIRPNGFSMIGNTKPTTNDMIYEEINLGVEDENYSKFCLFNPELIEETNYTIGCHSADIKTESKIWLTKNIKLLHFNYLSLDYVIDRYKSYKHRLSDENLKNKWGFHYQFKKQEIKEEYNYFLKIEKKCYESSK